MPWSISVFVLFSSLSWAISIIVLLLTKILGQKLDQANSKLSPFECGFSPMDNSRAYFSIQFFLVALIFLIFDLELVLIFPLLPSLALRVGQVLALNYLVFIIALVLGLVVE